MSIAVTGKIVKATKKILKHSAKQLIFLLFVMVNGDATWEFQKGGLTTLLLSFVDRRSIMYVFRCDF